VWDDQEDVLRAHVPFGSIVQPESDEPESSTAALAWWAPASASHSHFWLASDQTHFPPFVSTTSFESKVEDELAAPELELDC